jgi:twitching motility protein PilT
MGEFIPDPELDQLIQEMNRGPTGAGGDEPGHAEWEVSTLREVGPDEPLDGVLGGMVSRNASDLLLVPGSPPVIRVDGRLQSMELPKVDASTVRELFGAHIGRRAQQQLADRGSADFSLRLAGRDDETGWRLRVNIQRQNGLLAAAVRTLPRRIPVFNELNMPEAVAGLTAFASGLVLVCGPTGSGKTTTLAALLDTINRNEFRHVITIEDPVEYEHLNRRSVFEQVEIGSDAPEFAVALRAALRRDPDVLLVGEMRDLETMSTTITAAETGHLVFSTLHTSDSAQAINRVIDVFPAEQQTQVRHQLSISLRAIVCQQLLPRADGAGRVPAVEILVATYAVRNHIRRGNLDRLYNELIGGRGRGMCSMEQSLVELVSSGVVDRDEARARAGRTDELDRMLS